MSTIGFHIQRGFTLVEILIVITVIGILASITVVSYNGIQNRGYDAAVQSDLEGMQSSLESYKQYVTQVGEYPRAKVELEALNIKVSKSSYTTTTTVNFVYCINTTDYTSYAIAALSRSGKSFIMTQTGFTDSTLTVSDFASSTTLCNTALGMGLVSGGMYAPNTWHMWARS